MSGLTSLTAKIDEIDSEKEANHMGQEVINEEIEVTEVMIDGKLTLVNANEPIQGEPPILYSDSDGDEQSMGGGGGGIKLEVFEENSEVNSSDLPWTR